MKIVVFSSAVVALAVCASAFGQVQIPHQFSSGGPARAADVNMNFEALAAGINANTAAIRNLPAGPAGPPGPAGTADTAAASVAVVAAIGGNYATPQDALANLTAGDAWCRAANADPAAFPCVISIAPGIYELPQTLVVPPFVAVVGYGPKSTVLRALPGVQVAVQLGVRPPDNPVDLGISLRDIAVENALGAQSISVALELPVAAGIEVLDVRALAIGPSESIAVRVAGQGSGAANRIESLEAHATGGASSIGLHIERPGANQRLERCSITAAGGGTNVGVESAAFATLSQCRISAMGGHTAIAVRVLGEGSQSNTAIWVDNSTLQAREATTVSTGFYGRRLIGAIFRDVAIEASGGGENTGVWLSQNPPFGEGYFDGVRAEVSGGVRSTGMYNEGGHFDGQSMTVIRSSFAGFGYGGQGYGIRLGSSTEGPRLSLVSSTPTGSTASMFYEGPPRDVSEIGGPPLVVHISDSQIGPLSMGGHFVKCVAVRDSAGFYPSTCPPGSVYTPSPF